MASPTYSALLHRKLTQRLQHQIPYHMVRFLPLLWLRHQITFLALMMPHIIRRECAMVANFPDLRTRTLRFPAAETGDDDESEGEEKVEEVVVGEETEDAGGTGGEEHVQEDGYGCDALIQTWRISCCGFGVGERRERG